jgi:hypothetical protein
MRKIPDNFTENGFKYVFFYREKVAGKDFAFYRLYDERDNGVFVGVVVFVVGVAKKKRFSMNPGDEYLKKSINAGGVDSWHFQEIERDPAEKQAADWIGKIKAEKTCVLL